MVARVGRRISDTFCRMFSPTPPTPPPSEEDLSLPSKRSLDKAASKKRGRERTNAARLLGSHPGLSAAQQPLVQRLTQAMVPRGGKARLTEQARSENAHMIRELFSATTFEVDPEVDAALSTLVAEHEYNRGFRRASPESRHRRRRR